MKKIYALVALLFLSLSVQAQEPSSREHYPQGDKTLWEMVSKLEKKQDKINVFLNMRGEFDANFEEGNFQDGSFQVPVMRLGVLGRLNKLVSYSLQQRIGHSSNGRVTDGLSSSVDVMSVGIHPNEKLRFDLGRQCAVYGGYEAWLNPIDVYQFSEMLDRVEVYLTGVNASYMIKPTQELQFQVVNSRRTPTAEMYGPSYADAKLPMIYTLNWNGSFFNEKLTTRWSASLIKQAKGNNGYYFAFGHEWTLGRFNGYFDYMLSEENIDAHGYVTDMLHTLTPDVKDHVRHTRYNSLILKLNYRFLPRWNVFAKGYYETSALTKPTLTAEKGLYRRSYAYMAGVEFYPMKENLHFFINYYGRSHVHTPRAKVFGAKNHTEARLSAGFVYQLPIF